MHALKGIFKDQLTEAPKPKQKKKQTGYSSHIGWTFLAKRGNDRPQEPKAVRTYKTLFAASNEYTYFTPNTFCHNKKRDQEHLRWINTFSIDLDVKGQTFDHIPLHDIVFAVISQGLPDPSLIVKTPSGGLHIHWYLDKSRRAYKKQLKDHYKRILKVIIEELACYGADPLANSPERYFRIPTEDNVIYQSEKRASFDTFADWYSDKVTERQEKKKKLDASLKPGQVLIQHAAVQKLLKGVEKGQRDHTCYTLALAFKASGYDQKSTEKRLHAWNRKNDPAMRALDIKRKVKSAFKKGAPAGPSSEWISRLSGMLFTYQVWEEAKPRNERVYSHLSEWKEDILAYIRERNGQVIGSQRDLCEAITSSVNRKQKISYSTFKRAIASLEESGELQKEVVGKGRGAVTTFTIQEQIKPLRTPLNDSEKKKEEPKKRNGFNSNTPMDPVVGGSAIPSPALDSFSLPGSLLPTSSSPAPVPTNVPERFISAFYNRELEDGRLIFGAWGKIQLAFKSFSIPYQSIAASHAYVKLACEAVGNAVAKKRSSLFGSYPNTDRFYKYLYGTMKGLLAQYRQDILDRFVEDIEGLSVVELLSIGCDLEALAKDPQEDQLLIQDQLFELGLEEAAARRRKAAKKQTGLLSFNWVDSD